MKKRDLLNFFDDDLLDKLFGFCYARTNDSYEAEELCSDIIYALVKAAHSDGEIESVYPFIWRVARNVYAHTLEECEELLAELIVNMKAEIQEEKDKLELMMKQEETENSENQVLAM